MPKKLNVSFIVFFDLLIISLFFKYLNYQNDFLIFHGTEGLNLAKQENYLDFKFNLI
jgi:hypothetical protein